MIAPFLAVLCLGALASNSLGQPASEASESVPQAPDALGESQSRVQKAMERAQAQGLPAGWLSDKVAEGMAKRVPAPRIAVAVDQLLERMVVAQRIASEARPRGRKPQQKKGKPEGVGERGAARGAASRGGRTPPGLLRGLVDALAVGASEQSLRQLVKGAARRAAGPRQQHHVERWVVTVAELGERGFPGQAAARASLTALQRAGVHGWGRLLTSSQGIGLADPATRGEKLKAAAKSLRPGAERPSGAGPRGGVPGGPPAGRGGPPMERGGPPHDQSFGQGQGRGAGMGMEVGPGMGKGKAPPSR